MSYSSIHSRKFDTRKLLWLFILSLAILLVSPYCKRWLLSFWPPDLSNCTRLDVIYHPSTLMYFVPMANHENILNKAEEEYLKSLDSFTIDDKECITAFSNNISLGKYCGRTTHKPFYLWPVNITCYRNKKRIISFTVYGDMIITECGSMFKYTRGSLKLSIITPSEILPFKLRYKCAKNIGGIYTSGPFYRKQVNFYPDLNEWCDSMVNFWRSQYDIVEGIKKRRINEIGIFRTLTCPAIIENATDQKSFGKLDGSTQPEQTLPILECHYAMNPNCEPNSPGDMVLLFETKAGWNQHGGPELFTFDNHNPKGGCILLNDGKVKFIRTKEELNALRWK